MVQKSKKKTTTTWDVWSNRRENKWDNLPTYQPTIFARQILTDPDSVLRSESSENAKSEKVDAECPAKTDKKMVPKQKQLSFFERQEGMSEKIRGQTTKVHGKICLDDFCLFSDVVHWLRDFEELPLRLWIATLNFVNGGLPWMDVFRWLCFSSQTWKHNMVICAMATMNKSAIWISFVPSRCQVVTFCRHSFYWKWLKNARNASWRQRE